jgi:BASS family bile acid:Na+ symporter
MRLGTMALLVIVAGSIGSGRARPMEHGGALLGWIIVFCVVSQQLSMIPFRIFKLPAEDRLAVGIEMTIRDINLALLLKAGLFPAGKGDESFGNAVLFVTLCYGGTALVVGAITAVIFRFVLHPRNRKSPAELLTSESRPTKE